MVYINYSSLIDFGISGSKKSIEHIVLAPLPKFNAKSENKFAKKFIANPPYIINYM